MKCSRFSSQSRNRQRSEAMREALRSRFCCHPSHALHRAFRGPAAAVAVDRVILVQVSYVAETRRSVSGVEHFSVPAPQTLTCKVFQGFEVVVGRSLSIKGSYPLGLLKWSLVPRIVGSNPTGPTIFVNTLNALVPKALSDGVFLNEKRGHQ